MRTHSWLGAVISLSLLAPACAQTVPPVPPAAVAPSTSNPASDSELAAIAASKKVPQACLAEIQSKGALNFQNDQLCPLYLILSSPQYQRMHQKKRQALLDGLKTQLADKLADPTKQKAIVNGALSAYKTLSQQDGASSGASGTTSLVAKGAASELLSLASEYGAVTQTTSGATTTFSGTLAGVPLALMNKGLLQSCATDIYDLFGTRLCANPKAVSALSSISYSVSVNTSSNSQSITATGSSTASAVPAMFASSSSPSINAASVKWIAIQGKPATDALSAAVTKYQSTSAPAAARTYATYFQMQQHNDANFPTWETPKRIHLASYDNSSKGTQAAVSEWLGLADAYVTEVTGQAKDADPTPSQEEYLETAAAFAVAYAESVAEQLTVSTAIARPAVLTFEYDANLPSGQPSNSAIRGIYQAKVGGWTLTANGAVSLYNAQPSTQVVGSSLLRDFQIAVEADRSFSIKLPTGKLGMTGTGAFYDQDQTSPAILNVTPGSPVNGVTFTGLPSTATQVYAQKGNIAVGQFRLSIGSGSNIHVPLSVTYSNRTELVTSPVWRGQIGIAYDLDSLFQSK